MKTESVAWSRAKDALQRKLGTGEILDALPIGVYCCDLEGLLVIYNATRRNFGAATPNWAGPEWAAPIVFSP